MGRTSSARDDKTAPHHARTFDTFSGAINLTAQAAPTPDHAASALRICNTHAEEESVVTVVMSDGTSVALTIPFNWAETIRGSFKEITSVADGTVTITAFWHDFG